LQTWQFRDSREDKMTVFNSALAAAALLAAGLKATAQTSVPPQLAETVTGRSDANKIVCKKEEKIGSRLGGKKVCMTVADWQARQAADRDLLERVQSGTKPACSNDPGECGLGFGPMGPH
jgi:hypothetical protein